MPRERKKSEPEQEAGAPEWMVTFSDCMTLLLTFFVLLLSFSSFDNQDDFRKMNSSFANQFSFAPKETSEKDSLTAMPPAKQELHWGSEKPTLSDGSEDRFKRQSEPSDFLQYKTFLISSNDVFWGRGTAISTYGKKTLTDLALFLKEFPGFFVVVSESGPEDTAALGSVGLDRAWAVFDYLKTEKGISHKQLSISAAGTAVKEYHVNSVRQGNTAARDRMLEIVLLKRSI
jgi:chemotaxis protein MotB